MNLTKKEFKEALLRGQGRCIPALRRDPEKYRPILLWACGHPIAFDPQCEGTRAWFLYQLLRFYGDQEPFLTAAIESFRKATSDGGWKMLYLAELLAQWANDGEEAASDALWTKYEALYAALLGKKRPPEGIFPERDDFAMLCQVLADHKDAMVRIAEDIGHLYLATPFYDGFDFQWLFDDKAKKYMKTLQKQAQTSPEVAAYLQYGKARQEEVAQRCQGRSAEPERTLSKRALSVWLRRKADPQTVLKYAEAYLAQTDPARRAEALSAFSRCPFPGDPAPILADAQSGQKSLQTAAWEALENIRHPAVRQLALAWLERDMEAALPALMANYQPEDEAMLTALVTKIPADFQNHTNWHGIHGDILAMEDHGKHAPAALLRHIYETTYCSCCREYALRQMGKRRLLGDEILEECLLDSNDDIRAYAMSILRRRQKRQHP